ncbi:tetratricopeptide repeat protein [Salinactinospora qingdaonensis]|uniref:tetratricopeptide repeat protein n=1 Tax=Salinactinospora qingdaonensis TaxID=702744 RepID=UPI0031E9548D
MDRRRFLNSAVYSLSALTLPLGPATVGAAERNRVARTGGTIGAAEVDTVREVTAVFNRADERLGGNASRSAVVEYLSTDIVAYCQGNFASDTVRRDMFGAAAELAYLAGWKAHDAGRAGLAQRYYLHAFRLAEEADPQAHAGYVLRILAHQAFDNGYHDHCVDLAEAALSRVRGYVDAETESLFWLTLARAQAFEGDRRTSLDAICHAEALMNAARDDEPPRWASLGGPAEARLANQTAKALAAMGDMSAAEGKYRHASQCWNPTTHPRIYALTLADLGSAQLAQGYLDAACATWTTALEWMDGVNSARARDAVADIRSDLSAFRTRGVTSAKLMDERARRWQAANA